MGFKAPPQKTTNYRLSDYFGSFRNDQPRHAGAVVKARVELLH